MQGQGVFLERHVELLCSAIDQLRDDEISGKRKPAWFKTKDVIQAAADLKGYPHSGILSPAVRMATVRKDLGSSQVGRFLNSYRDELGIAGPRRQGNAYWYRLFHDKRAKPNISIIVAASQRVPISPNATEPVSGITGTRGSAYKLTEDQRITTIDILMGYKSLVELGVPAPRGTMLVTTDEALYKKYKNLSADDRKAAIAKLIDDILDVIDPPK